jgi:hypothetical protein
MCFDETCGKYTRRIAIRPFVLRIKSLKPSGNYTYHLLYQWVNVHFVFMSLLWSSVHIAIISLNSVNQLIFVMVKYGVLFEVRTGFLNNI